MLKVLTYDPKRQGLVVTYRDDNARFIYFMSPELAKAIQNHPDKGSLWLKIRKNYKYERI